MADWKAAQAVAAAWPSAAEALLSRVTTVEDAVAALLSGVLDDAERDPARREWGVMTREGFGGTPQSERVGP